MNGARGIGDAVARESQATHFALASTGDGLLAAKDALRQGTSPNCHSPLATAFALIPAPSG